MIKSYLTPVNPILSIVILSDASLLSMSKLVPIWCYGNPWLSWDQEKLGVHSAVRLVGAILGFTHDLPCYFTHTI